MPVTMALWRRNPETREVDDVLEPDGSSPEVTDLLDDIRPTASDAQDETRPRRPSLAALLTEGGLVSEEQVHEALAEGEQTGERLGEVVVRRGWASEEELARLLARQWGLPAVDPGALSLDPLAVAKLDSDAAAELGGFPVWFDEHSLVVAVAEPSEERFAAFRELLGSPSFVVVPRTTLQELLESRLFGGDGHAGQSGPVTLVTSWTERAGDGEAEEVEPGAAPESPGAGSLAERLRALEADADGLERALAEAQAAVGAGQAELAALQQDRERDLVTIHRLEAEIDARDARLRALREKVADLTDALDG